MRRCSVIIVTYNSGMQIEACVRALASQDCEIIVVDNVSSDDTTTRVRGLADEITLTLLAQDRNLGFAGGVNEGARVAAGETLLILNPDAIAETGAVDALLSCLSVPNIAAAGGALLDENGSPERGFSFRRLPTLASLLFEVLLINQLWPANPVNRRYRCLDADLTGEQEIEQPAGACLAVKRATWENAGGMDTQFYPVWFEDVDLCLRLKKTNARIIYCPWARFHHGGAHSLGKLAFEDKQVFWYTNMLRYVSKHFSAGAVLALRAGIVAGMGLRMLACFLGSKPADVSRNAAVKSYWKVAKIAMS